MTTIVDRFWAKVDRGAPDGHWLWTAAIGTHGYGVLSLGYGRGTVLAHRYVLKLLGQPPPGSMQVDHLCKVRACVNPAHLEVVTQRENIARQVHSNRFTTATHCIHGHPFDAANTYWRPTGGRACKICRARIYRAYRARTRRVAA